MKKHQLLFILLISTVFMYGQSTDQNYIKTTQYIAKGGDNPIAEGTNYLEINTVLSSGNYFAKDSIVLTSGFHAVYGTEILLKIDPSATGSTADIDPIVSITYFDGLGRPKQQIAIGQSPNGNDIITHIAYDDFGRQAQNFLPYVPSIIADAGSFRTNNQSNAIDTYYQAHYSADLQGEVNPYSKKSFEASPLNRVLEQAAPGSDWSIGTIDTNTGYSDGHTIKFDYQSNTLDLNDESQDNVRLFSVERLNNNYKPKLINDKPTDYYAANQLYKTITKDENWSVNQSGAKDKNHTTEEFKDKQGRVVLKRTYNANTTNTSFKKRRHDTYYVYDDYGNLTYVIPPRADIKNNQSTRTRALNELCYQYQYDQRNRLIKKKIPGKGWEKIVYDKLDRPILTQSKNLKDQSKWLFTKYDALGRVTYTGKYTSGQNRNQLQAQADTYIAVNLYEDKTAPASIGDATVSYSHRSFPTDNLKVLTVNYYDNYDNFNLDGGINPNTVYTKEITTNTKSLATSSQVRVLGTSQWINTVSYYDKKARPIYSYSKNNYLNTVDVIKTKLDFIAKVLETTAEHIKGTDTIKIVDKFTYDNMGRLLAQTQKIDNQPLELIATNTYDELGQLTKKGIGNKQTGLESHLQDVDYTYNIRGWLKTINDPEQALTDDLFAFKLNYNTISTTAGGTSRLLTKELYNGNISETIWRTANDDKKRGYGYQYDALNRIKRARYKAGDNLTTEKQFFDIKAINYDKNGNIKRLDRFSPNDTFDTKEETDHLTYKYYQLSNRLKSVTDDVTGNNKGFKDGNTSNDDYGYDPDGNLTSDKNKGITSIVYNHLNLPTLIDFGSSNKIEYFYDASGIKLKKKVTDNGNTITTDYAGNYVYEDDVLKQFSQPEGYVEPNGSGSYNYVYAYTDHLGSVRLTYSDLDGNGSINPSTEILQERNTYPFGLQHKGYNNVINGTENNYKTYQGQEISKELGYNMLEFKYRHYDPAIARFVAIDPLASKYAYNSTYAFQENKLGLGVELEGLELERLRGGIEQFFQGVENLVSNETYGEAYRQMETSKTTDTQKQEQIKQEGQLNTVQAIGDMGEGGIEAIKGGSKVLGKGLENIGDAGSVLSIATGQVEFLPITEGISTAGSLINAGVDYSDGKPLVGIGVEFGVSAAFGELGDQMVKGIRRVAGKEFIEAGKNKVSESIIQGTVKVWESIFTPVIVTPNTSTTGPVQDPNKE
ncbi:MAG: DUF6443 domain-containing protein [Flavobacteriaceae bacterium]|nr:DUF6443 domain-containing protein [Flavobacteriaceae bacterium]